MDCTWDRKEGLRGALSANKPLSQGTVSMLNARYKTVSASLRNCQKTHSVSIINMKTNYLKVSAQSARMSPRKVSVCLRAVSVRLRVKCPYVSPQSVRMSPLKMPVCLRANVRMSPRKVFVCLGAVSACLRAVSVCLRAKGPMFPRNVSVFLRSQCPYVFVQCPYVSAQRVLCFHAKCPYFSAHSVRMSSCKVSIPFVNLYPKSQLSTNFSKTPKIRSFAENSSSGSSAVRSRRTDE